MRNRALVTLLLLAGALAMSVVPVSAQGRGRGQQNKESRGENFQKSGRGRSEEQARERRVDFGEHDRDVIVSYYSSHRSNLPPGLAKRGTLPPGLEKQLRRNGQLPPGLQKRVVWFPAALDVRLGPLPEGYRRCWVGADVLIVSPKTFAILDIIRDVAILAH